MSEKIMSEIINPTLIQNALSYSAYRKLVDELLAEKRTTGDFGDNSPEILEYTRVNVARMKRGDKTFKLNEELGQALESVSSNWLWLVLTEGWCGDAAQNIPALVHMAEVNPAIQIRFLLRDENLPLMDAHLTNGGRAIPKLIALDADTLEELGTWGPRPDPAQEMARQYKLSGSTDYDSYTESLHKWYALDKYQAIQQEMLERVKAWSKSQSNSQ